MQCDATNRLGCGEATNLPGALRTEICFPALQRDKREMGARVTASFSLYRDGWKTHNALASIQPSMGLLQPCCFMQHLWTYNYMPLSPGVWLYHSTLSNSSSISALYPLFPIRFAPSLSLCHFTYRILSPLLLSYYRLSLCGISHFSFTSPLLSPFFLLFSRATLLWLYS